MMTAAIAKAITGTILFIMVFLVGKPLQFACFYFLLRPLVQPFAYNQYTLVGSIPLTAVFSLCLMGYSFSTLALKNFTIFAKNSIFLYLMLFFFVVSSLFSISYFSTISFTLKFMTGLMMYLLVYNSVKSERDFLRLAGTFLLSALLPMAFGYYQYVTGSGHAWKGEFYAGSRIDSFLGEYNAYGEFLCIVICTTMVLLAKTEGRKRRIFVIGAFASLLVSLALSLNRGSWIALIFALLVSSVFFIRHIKIRWVILGLVTCSLAFGGIVIERFQELEVRTDFGSKNTLEGRAEHWKRVYALVMERPILGFGAGTSQVVLGKEIDEDNAVHNDYLLLWFECGIFTAIAYILFLASNALYFLTRSNHSAVVNFAMASVCIYFLVISFTQNIIMNVTVFPMYLGAVGAGMKLDRLAQEAETSLQVRPLPLRTSEI